jgi:hypothetical protein
MRGRQAGADGPMQVSDALERFVGRRCIGYKAGGAAGSHVSLELEPRVKRPRPLTHPALSEEQRLTEASHAILVSCAWRLDSESKVICGAWDDNSPGGPMLTGLDQLIGSRLISFTLTPPGLDLELRFEGASFRVFCDNVNAIDGDDNYVLFLPEESVTVAVRSRIEWAHGDGGWGGRGA